MKKILLLAVVIGLVMSGCGPVKKYCTIIPTINTVYTATTGSPMIVKQECFGRVTVNDCSACGLYYLGKVGGDIRIQGKIGEYSSFSESPHRA